LFLHHYTPAFLTKFFSVHHGSTKKDHGPFDDILLQNSTVCQENCYKTQKNISPHYFDIFFSKKIAKSSSKALKKESFEAKNGCLTILQKAIYICYILCTKERILRLVKKEKNLG